MAETKPLQAEFDRFVGRNAGNPIQMASLRKFLEKDPLWEAEAPVLPADRAEMQRDRIRKIIANQRRDMKDENFQFTAQQIACLLLAPKPYLELHQSFLLPDQWELKYNNLLRSFLIRPIETDPTADASIATSKKRPLPTDDDKDLPRNHRKATAARDRDGGQCVLTGAGWPQVAHIVPFCINNSVTKLSKFEREIKAVKNPFPIQNYSHLNHLYDGGPRCTDHPWNMLTLSSTIHSAWAEAKFGICWKDSWIEEQDITITKVKLQIRFLKQDIKTQDGETLRQHRLIDIDNDEEFLSMISIMDGIHGVDDHDSEQGKNIMNMDALSNRLLPSGTIFHIRIPTVDAEKMQTMIDFQWACLCIHKMAGGGRPEDLPIFDVHPPEEPDEVYTKAIREYEEEL